MKNALVYAVYGKSGFGREIMSLVVEQIKDRKDTIKVFIDDENTDATVNGYDVWTFEKLADLQGVTKKVSIAIADGKIRKRLSQKCKGANLDFMPVSSNLHVRMDNCVIGEGAIFSPYTTLTSNIKIGCHFHCNIYSYVAHDCIIGDFVTFAPRVNCNGCVHIEDYAYIGTGAILKQGTPEKPLLIGKGAIVGMGAVVTKDVAPGTVVVGNPARPLMK